MMIMIVMMIPSTLDNYSLLSLFPSLIFFVVSTSDLRFAVTYDNLCASIQSSE